MSSNVLSLDRSRIVFVVHLLVGLGMAVLGAYRLSQGSVAGAVLNVGIGAVVVYLGYRMADLV
ncbi:MAG: hypothetical protein V5A23_03660 [Halobacteriales archaeon]